jgi:hypothetical protein
LEVVGVLFQGSQAAAAVERGDLGPDHKGAEGLSRGDIQRDEGDVRPEQGEDEEN